jgi:hypothetical protein
MAAQGARSRHCGVADMLAVEHVRLGSLPLDRQMACRASREQVDLRTLAHPQTPGWGKASTRDDG